MLERGADPNAAETLENQTALMWATAEGHLHIVNALLEAGANPNAQARVSELKKRSMRADFPSGGFTALMWAARNGDEAIVRRLIDGGADVKLANGDGSTAMMLAIANDRFDMAAMLLELGADANDGSLFYAVEMRDAPTDWRARDGSRLRADHPNKLTALDLIGAVARRRRRPEQAVHRPDALGLHVLRHERQRHAVLSRGRRRRRRCNEAVDRGRRRPRDAPKPIPGAPPMPFGDYTGLTPLMAALNGGKGMLMAGGPGDIREGKIGIFREPGNRNPADAVKLLLEAGANPNALSGGGDTALHLAAYGGHLEPIRELIAGGADVSVRDAKGLTPLQLVESMQPRKLDPIAEMVGIFDDGAQPKETAAFLREAIAARDRAGATKR